VGYILWLPLDAPFLSHAEAPMSRVAMPSVSTTFLIFCSPGSPKQRNGPATPAGPFAIHQIA